ncbi:MAG TPA: SLC13 family permease [Methanoregulaceae archaeon]|nr:MAG: anion transporter [Methanolinea sp.]HON81494.1 SLC13 family permease [Methanoregulaceae archaeon]HPD10300.1 SLC13 family permease [Methanoregulaceae archaeon]HRT15470.1 SLC13 family permease [Methanoregulaceae archaeon]HRU30943.1 SLC13 family permease [Methanoregulaceae archaeon]
MAFSILPLIVLALVFVLIAVRQVGRLRIRIWQIMLAGAIAVLLFGQISPADALRSINAEVMFFLFGMFVVGAAVTESGYLRAVSSHFFSRARTPDCLLLAMMITMGLFSALMMNDTMAIIGTPLILWYALRTGINPKGALLALCFAITIGSVATPIGNPQNLLLAQYAELGNAFTDFLAHLALPTAINLVIAWLVVRFFYPPPQECPLPPRDDPVKNEALARLSKLSLCIILALVGVQIVMGLTGRETFPLMLIALAGAAPVLIASPNRYEILMKVDWYTLAFFAAMFVLMQSVYDTGFFQGTIDYSHLTTIPVIMTVSVVVSQFISNVPFVALFQPLIIQQGMSIQQILALAAGSTIAGDLTILGAASNVIVIQQAEQEGYSLTFWEFFRVGLPLTVLNIMVYSVFLSI